MMYRRKSRQIYAYDYTYTYSFFITNIDIWYIC